MRFILTRHLTSSLHFLPPGCRFNCVSVGWHLLCLCFCHLVLLCLSVCACACCVCFTVCAPCLFRAPLLSLPTHLCPHPQHSQASLCTRSLRWWRRTGLLGLNATLKGCQHLSLLGRRTKCRCPRSLGECPIGVWAVGRPERALGCAQELGFLQPQWLHLPKLA